jgi:hypothetical protein
MKIKLKLCDGCGEHKRIFKNVTEDGVRKRLCTWCSKAYDANQKPKHKPTKPRKSIAPRSPKRAKQERQYSKEAKQFKEDNPHCNAAIPGVCTGLTFDVHHKGGRENDLLLYVPWWLATCRMCHDWIHANPKEARELNLLI